jgi:hypothetical protein
MWDRFKAWFKEVIYIAFNLYTAVVIATYIVFACNMAISYFHAWELFSSVGRFPGIFSYIAVVAFDTVFAACVLIISKAKIKKIKVGFAVWFGAIFGGGITAWSNVRASMGDEWYYLVTFNFKKISPHGWESMIAGLSTLVALIAIESLLAWMTEHKDDFVTRKNANGGAGENTSKTTNKKTGEETTSQNTSDKTGENTSPITSEITSKNVGENTSGNASVKVDNTANQIASERAGETSGVITSTKEPAGRTGEGGANEMVRESGTASKKVGEITKENTSKKTGEVINQNASEDAGEITKENTSKKTGEVTSQNTSENAGEVANKTANKKSENANGTIKKNTGENDKKTTSKKDGEGKVIQMKRLTKEEREQLENEAIKFGINHWLDTGEKLGRPTILEKFPQLSDHSGKKVVAEINKYVKQHQAKKDAL